MVRMISVPLTLSSYEKRTSETTARMGIPKSNHIETEGPYPKGQRWAKIVRWRLMLCWSDFNHPCLTRCQAGCLLTSCGSALVSFISTCIPPSGYLF